MNRPNETVFGVPAVPAANARALIVIRATAVRGEVQAPPGMSIAVAAVVLAAPMATPEARAWPVSAGSVGIRVLSCDTTRYIPPAGSVAIPVAGLYGMSPCGRALNNTSPDAVMLLVWRITRKYCARVVGVELLAPSAAGVSPPIARIRPNATNVPAHQCRVSAARIRR